MTQLCQIYNNSKTYDVHYGDIVGIMSGSFVRGTVIICIFEQLWTRLSGRVKIISVGLGKPL